VPLLLPFRLPSPRASPKRKFLLSHWICNFPTTLDCRAILRSFLRVMQYFVSIGGNRFGIENESRQDSTRASVSKSSLRRGHAGRHFLRMIFQNSRFGPAPYLSKLSEQSLGVKNPLKSRC